MLKAEKKGRSNLFESDSLISMKKDCHLISKDSMFTIARSNGLKGKVERWNVYVKTGWVHGIDEYRCVMTISRVKRRKKVKRIKYTNKSSSWDYSYQVIEYRIDGVNGEFLERRVIKRYPNTHKINWG